MEFNKSNTIFHDLLVLYYEKFCNQVDEHGINPQYIVSDDVFIVKEASKKDSLLIRYHFQPWLEDDFIFQGNREKIKLANRNANRYCNC